jgi:hypothetical protein
MDAASNEDKNNLFRKMFGLWRLARRRASKSKDGSRNFEKKKDTIF